MLAREPFSDKPECVCPAIASFLRGFNDRLTDEERHVVWPYTTRVIGTANDGKTEERMFRFADWAVRKMAPTGLRARGFDEAAAKLEELSPVVDKASAKNAADAAAYAAADAADAADAAADAAATPPPTPPPRRLRRRRRRHAAARRRRRRRRRRLRRRRQG